ncbi:hypothetical protein JAAARDRAFT_181517 [Jaapia argillacea MUCL 33604]|uniref:Rho-GAP domain-containing protein n=1 Tax=Jaapia argillacea MUCL 33604 TaxID=933084 RepID=A0A067PU84_9AGAM|nr:hypothetical protein JAAARDRAFT_181517 [Jaapia argillacea MUCL 33604]
MSAVPDPPPTPRPNQGDGQTEGPIPLFDLQLRFLTDSYLSFFQERKRVEEAYVDSLHKLHRKAKAVDGWLDDRGSLNTTRSAWSEIRDNVDREAQTRQAFLATLDADVLNPLTALKETQERTRKRIKEDLKESIAAHVDYAENTLPRLKRNYLRKCQEVDEHKAAAAAAQTPSSSTASFQTDNSQAPLKPVVTAPQPLRPLDRRPSVTAPTRNRSPSSSTALSDLAHQGKKQLNQLMTFLDKANTGKDGLPSRPDALRTVKAKREADEADKEYRRAVHWLETLRLRRTKILEGGYKSLELFIIESAETLKKVLEKYTDNMSATTTTETALSNHGRHVVDKISPSSDANVIASRISRSLASAIPKPVLYYNYFVGECSDLIFGVSLVDYATSRGLSDAEIPRVVRLCIQEIDKRGLETEGVYRVSGRHAVVQELQHKIERNEKAFKFNPGTDDVYAVASLLKLYLRELPDPVFKFPLQDRIQHTEDLTDHASNDFLLLRGKMRRLPPVHQATLKAVVEHLARVAACCDKTKMDAHNLAIIFGTVIFGEDEMPKAGDLLSLQNYKDSLMEDLITNSQTLFEDRDSPSPEPPLPLPPSVEPVAPTYGSSHTKVASVPPSYVSTNRPPEDFTPAMPARPANSIHPSARANYPKSDNDLPPIPRMPNPAEHNVPPPSLSPLPAEVPVTQADVSAVNSSPRGLSEGHEDPQRPSSPEAFTTAASSPTTSPPSRLPQQGPINPTDSGGVD